MKWPILGVLVKPALLALAGAIAGQLVALGAAPPGDRECVERVISALFSNSLRMLGL